jgi:hypothetical protein
MLVDRRNAGPDECGATLGAMFGPAQPPAVAGIPVVGHRGTSEGRI